MKRNQADRELQIGGIIHAECVPKRWFSWEFRLKGPAGEDVAELQLSSWREKRLVTLKLQAFAVWLTLLLWKRDADAAVVATVAVRGS